MLRFLSNMFLGKKVVPLPEIEAVKQSTERIIKASKEFRTHSNTLAKLVKNMQGASPKTKRVSKRAKGIKA